MKGFSDHFIGMLVVFLSLTFGGACLRYIVTGSIANNVVREQPMIIPNVTINQQGDKTCWQFIGGECTK